MNLSRRYCVTVMDNWTAMRKFWTLKAARRFADSNPGSVLWHRIKPGENGWELV